MSALSRLAFALVVSVTACTEQPFVPPQSAGSGSMDIPAWAPINLSASFLDGQVVVSWNYTSSDNAYVSGFLVERALAPEGPWGIVRFTRSNSIHDILDAERYCYRVVVMGSSMATADAVRSRALCVESPATL